MKFIKIVIHLLQGIILLAIFTGAGIWLAGKYGYISPVNLYVVMSGSMEPAVPTGSVVAVVPKTLGYKPGDIITFKSGSKQTTTHRVVQLQTIDGELVYKTQGDANNNLDPSPVQSKDIVGSVFITAPYVGYAVDFAKTPQGFILLVIVPATIIIYEELKYIKNELVKLLRRLFGKGTAPTPLSAAAAQSSSLQARGTAVSAQKGVASAAPSAALSVAASSRSLKLNAPLPPKGHAFERFFSTITPVTISTPGKLVTKKSPSAGKGPNFAVIVPALAAATIFVSVSGAYFNDHELSIGNILGAAETFSSPQPTPTPTPPTGPTPTPGVAQTLVINQGLPDSSCFQGNTEAQWLEIYNGFNVTVDLKNYKITDGTDIIDLVNAVTNVPAGGLALLAHNSAIWNNCYDDNDVVTANLGGTLNIDTGLLHLLDASDVVIDTVEWGSSPLNPAQNQSIERTPVIGFDSAFGTNFNATDFTIKDPPTPGL